MLWDPLRSGLRIEPEAVAELSREEGSQKLSSGQLTEGAVAGSMCFHRNTFVCSCVGKSIRITSVILNFSCFCKKGFQGWSLLIQVLKGLIPFYTELTSSTCSVTVA